MFSLKQLGKISKRGIQVILLSSVVISTGAVAHNHKADKSKQQHSDIEISQAWARALPPVVPNGAAYFTLVNHSNKAIVLTGVSSDIAKHSMLHESYFDDGKVAMRHIEELVINPHKSVTFKPGGFHVMLMGLKKPLTKGGEFTMSFLLKDGSQITTPVKVKDAPSMKEHAHHH
ncbi:copper chaperone PCu(A)C [Psychrobium sp. nBUS_13]|uniref:copper chaperone PCu(A)C n=1 Tax=Psychrobium sp. nBUS_13 TaxID=3395319 RepID=UPI003EBC9FD3